MIKKYSKNFEEWNKESFESVRRNIQKAISKLNVLITTDIQNVSKLRTIKWQKLKYKIGEPKIKGSMA